MTGSSTFFSTWFRLAKQYPVAFNSFTGGSLCLTSDALAQYLEHRQQRQHPNSSASSRRNNDNSGMTTTLDDDTITTTMTYRIRRLLSAGMIGAVFGGFVYPKAYAKLDALWKGTHWRVVLQKSVVEILTVGIFVNTVSMTCRGLLVGRTPNDVAGHVVQEMPIVTITDARVWLPYNMIAFSVIPVPIRPTTTLMMEAGWQTYISIMSNNYHHHDGTHDEEAVAKKEGNSSYITVMATSSR